MWGLADSAFRPSALAKWREALPDAEVVALSGVGHWPHEEAPDEVIAALRRFVTPVRAGVRGAEGRA